MSNKLIEDVRFKRGDTAGNDAYTGPAGSLTIDQEDGSIRVHDGEAAGGAVKTVGRHHLTQSPDDQTPGRLLRHGDDAGLLRNFSRRNVLINGGFDIWQRGDSQTTSGYGSADRWYYNAVGSTHVSEKVAYVPEPNGISGYPVFYSRTTISSVAGPSNRVTISQRIEDVRLLAGKTCTFSFWARADSDRKIAVDMKQVFGDDAGASESIDGIGVRSFDLTTEWKKFVGRIQLPEITGKTLGVDHRQNFVFWLEAGGDFDRRSDGIGQSSGTVDIARVQLEEGLVPTEFEARSLGEELWLCQRYYERGRAIGRKDIYGDDSSGVAAFRNAKRVDPTITFINPVTGTVGQVRVTHSTSSGGYNLSGVRVYIPNVSDEMHTRERFMFAHSKHRPSNVNDFTLHVEYIADSEI